MSSDVDRVATKAIRDLASASGKIAGSMPPVDVEQIIEKAKRPRSIAANWVARSAAAAAILAAAVGALVLSRPHVLPDGPVPAHLTALVDSLYTQTDYVHDQLADVMWGSGQETSNYLDDVWDSVISGIEEL